MLEKSIPGGVEYATAHDFRDNNLVRLSTEELVRGKVM